MASEEDWAPFIGEKAGGQPTLEARWAQRVRDIPSIDQLLATILANTELFGCTEYERWVRPLELRGYELVGDVDPIIFY